jgi:hypothetical protein
VYCLNKKVYVLENKASKYTPSDTIRSAGIVPAIFDGNLLESFIHNAVKAVLNKVLPA